MHEHDRSSRHLFTSSGLRRRAGVVAATIALLSPLVPMSAASAAITGLALQAAPRNTAMPPLPNPAALPAQSPTMPFALQLLERFDQDTTPTSPVAAKIADTIDQGTPVREVVDSIARSKYAINESVHNAYTELLDRGPDDGGLDYLARAVGAGRSIEWVYASLAASAEFRAVNPTPASQVKALYMLMLNRPTDPAGLTYFSNMINGGTSADRVVYSLKGSPEYASITVIHEYVRVLHRPADAAGRAFWSRQIGQIGKLGLDTSLASSAESQRFGCDPLAGGSCMLPWPNNYYTVPDPSTSTGLRVNLKASFLPANASGVSISPVQSNRSDGFSPGSTIMVQVPGIDIAKSGMATIDKLGLNGPASPVVLVDTADGSTVPTWSELDVHGPYPNPNLQPLLIHPVKNLTDGHHYVVALRNLKNASGATLAAPGVFASYRDGTSNTVGGFNSRMADMDGVFAALDSIHIDRSSLYLAWDFTVASTANLTGRLLHIRDDAFSKLGTAAPSFTVATVTKTGLAAGIDRVVEGTFEVPNYLTGTGAPGSTFNEDASGLPQQNGMFTAPFRCVIPTSALTTPARPSLYGHGLFGSLSEVTAGNVQAMASEHNMVFCGTLWAGMSNEDVPTAAGILQDLSGFAKLADRNQQGVLNMLFLGRLMKLASGLSTDPAFQNTSGDPLLATGQLFYDGNSQGGIQGGLATAVATDWTRAVLGVSAINYSLLLPRSTDFSQFEAVMTPAYPAELDRLRGLSLIQLQWDRGEPDGYANHMTTDPLPGTPQHTVLMQIAFGDHQVSDYAADTEARTIGAKAYCPSFASGRVPDTRLLWGIDCIGAYPYDGSAIVYYDSGSDLPLLTDTAPTTGHDPHEDPRNDPNAREQKSTFLTNGGSVTDVCGTAPCTAAQN